MQLFHNRKLMELRNNNSAYSVRAFARRLGVSSGALSELLNGKRYPSRKLASRIAERLLLDPQERSEFLRAYPKGETRLRKSQTPETEESFEEKSSYLQLSAESFKLITEWQHFAILSLMNTVRFQSSTLWIARRLRGVSLLKVNHALERLKRLKMIVLDEKGNFKRSQSPYRTTDCVADLSIQKAHLEYLQEAKTALIEIPISDRDFTSVMMAVDPRKLAEARVKIRKFQDELSEFLESDPKTEVYQLCIQLFPLTHLNKGTEK